MCQISEHMQPCLDGSLLLVFLQQKTCLFVLCKYSPCLTENAERGKGRLREELKSEGKIPLMIHFCAWNLKFKVQTSFKGI